MRGGGIEGLPDGAMVVHVGDGLGFVMPWREFRASPSQIARIEVAATLGLMGLVLDDEALSAERRRLLAEVEAEMAREAKRRARLPEGRAVSTPAEVAAAEGPVALRSGRAMGLPAIVTDQGRLYQPEPHRERYDANKAPVMAKFDRVTAIAPPTAALDIATMSQDQADLLRQADDKLTSANRRRDARTHVDRFTGEILGYGRITQAERDERRFARDAYAQLGLGTLDKHDRDEIKRGRAESFALAEARGRRERRTSAAAYLSHLKRVSANRLSPDSRRSAIAREMRQFRAAMLEDARAAVLRDVAAGGRRLTRDGLDSLRLNPVERACAEWYRELYQRTERGARVASWEGRTGGREDTRASADWGSDQITRKQVEARVMGGRNGRAITALRLVAGEGRTISAISGGKSQNRRLNTEALIEALNVVADYRGLQ